MMSKGNIAGLTGSRLHDEIEKAMKNGESPDSFDIGHGLIFKSASSWEEIIDADKRGEPVVRRVYTESEKYDNLVQVLEWYPIKSDTIFPDGLFLITTHDSVDGVSEVEFNPEIGHVVNCWGNIQRDATHWTQKPKPPHKKE